MVGKLLVVLRHPSSKVCGLGYCTYLGLGRLQVDGWDLAGWPGGGVETGASHLVMVRLIVVVLLLNNFKAPYKSANIASPKT